MPPEQFNAADPKQVRSRQQKAKDRDDQQADELKKLLDLVEFRRYIWRILFEHGQLMQSPFHTSGSVMTQNVGIQDMARRLWTEIERADPLAIPKMMIEHHDDRDE